MTAARAVMNSDSNETSTAPVVRNRTAATSARSRGRRRAGWAVQARVTACRCSRTRRPEPGIPAPPHLPQRVTLPRMSRRSATMRRLLALARPEAGLLAAGLVFLAIGSAATLLYPQGVRVVIDAALGRSPEWADEVGRARLLELVAIAMAGIALVSAAAMGIRF